MANSHPFTRRPIYDLIWSVDFADAATRLGISEGHLAHICDQHRVPRPSRNYWSAIRAGKKQRQAILLEVPDDDVLNTIHLYVQPTPLLGDNGLQEPTRVRARAKHKKVYRFRVADWGWLYHLKALTLDDRDDQSDTESEAFEILDLSGILSKPRQLSRRAIRLSIYVGSGPRAWQFRADDIAHVGLVHVSQEPIDAEVTLEHQAVTRLTQVLTAEKRCG